MGNNLSRRVPAAVSSFGNGTADAAEQALTLEGIVGPVLEETFNLRGKIDNLVVDHQENAEEFRLLRIKLTKFLKFIKEKVYLTETGTTTRRRRVIEELQKWLGILEGDLRKLAHDVHVEAKQVSSVTRQAIVYGGISIAVLIAAAVLTAGNATAMVLSTGCVLFVGGYTFSGDRISEKQIKDLLSDIHTCRQVLTEKIVELATLLLSDMLTDQDDLQSPSHTNWY